MMAPPIAVYLYQVMRKTSMSRLSAEKLFTISVVHLRVAEGFCMHRLSPVVVKGQEVLLSLCSAMQLPSFLISGPHWSSGKNRH